MTTPDADRATETLADVPASGTPNSNLTVPVAPPAHPTLPWFRPQAKKQTIHVSPAVLDAARKNSDQLLVDLHTSLSGLTEADAEERARTAGPNEVAQER